MLGTIIRKEIVSNLLSYKFFIIILLASLLIFTSFFIMYRDYKGQLANYQLIRPKPEDPMAVIPPNPLAVFVKGLEDAMTRSFEISRIGINVRTGQQSGNIIFSFFPAPDFLYVVKVVISLVALLFGFDQVSREKEAGTLRQMLSNSVPRAKILLGKWTGNFLSLAVPFLIVTMLGTVLMNADPEVHFSAAHLARLALIVITALIYIALFLSLGIFISTLTRRAATSLIILLFIWALAVFVLPNLGTLLARQVVDVPSVRALSEKRQQVRTREVLLAEVERGQAGYSKQTYEIYKRHYVAIDNELDKLEENYRGKFNNLVRLAKNINRISPVASFVYVLTDLAGTGIGEESRLKAQVIRHKDVLLQEFDQNKKEHAVFLYRYSPLSRVFLEGGLFDLSWIVFFNILFFALSYFVFVRYDAR